MSNNSFVVSPQLFPYLPGIVIGRAITNVVVRRKLDAIRMTVSIHCPAPLGEIESRPVAI
jgi:hypothetical protein